MVHRVLSLFGAPIVLVVLLIGGCAAGSPADDTAGARLQFTAKTLDGQEFSGESLIGKPAVLWFWAPWCPACQQEAPLVAEAARKAKAGNPKVTFVGVGAQDELPALQKFATKYGVDTFTELADTKAAVWAKFGVTRQPAYAFITSDGHVDVVKGSLSEAELAQRVEALAAQ